MLQVKIRCLLFFWFIVPFILWGQGKYSNEFLSIGVGARAQALGNAVVAGVNDVTAGTWNPAGLADYRVDKGLQIGAMHAEWFAGVGKFDYLGVSLPMNNGNRVLGLSLIRFGIDNIPNTLTLYESDGTINYDNVSSFSAADYAFLMSYAQPWRSENSPLFVGGSLKIVHRQIGPFATSWGFGIDLGAQYRKEKFSLGILAKDISTTFNAWSFSFTDDEKEVLALTNNEIPINSFEITKPQIIMGGNYRFEFNNIGISPELDLIFTTDGKRNTLVSADPISIDPAFGIEGNYKGFVFLRAGVNQFQKLTNFDQSITWISKPSLGVGLKFSTVHIDYAFTDLGDERNTYSHIISLMLDIKPRNGVKKVD